MTADPKLTKMEGRLSGLLGSAVGVKGKEARQTVWARLRPQSEGFSPGPMASEEQTLAIARDCPPRAVLVRKRARLRNGTQKTH